MNFGFILMFDGSQGQSTKLVYDETIEYIRASELAGFSTIWLTEHHGKSNRLCPSIPLMMSHLSSYTDLELGAATILLSHYDARHIAEKIGLLSNLAKNNFLYGFARGGNGEVLLHDDGDECKARDEMIKKITELFNHLNNHTDGSFPKPTQEQKFFLASKDDTAVRYAAEHDLGVMAGQKWTLDEVRAVRDKYSAYHPQHKPPELMLSRYLLINKNENDAIDRIRLETERRKMQKSKQIYDDKNPLKEWVLANESPVGPIEKAEKLFQTYKDLGVNRLAFRQATFDFTDTISSIRRIGELIKNMENSQ